MVCTEWNMPVQCAMKENTRAEWKTMDLGCSPKDVASFLLHTANLDPHVVSGKPAKLDGSLFVADDAALDDI